MPLFTTRDGISIFYKDWGTGQPLVFSHGWPLTADDWDSQLLYFLDQGYRVIAHDRRGHGRSTQTWQGNDMDTYADDLNELVTHLNLKNAIHIGHSTGGGEVARYIGKHGTARVKAAVLISSVPPLMLQTNDNPGGLPLKVFDEIREGIAHNRAQYYVDFSLPFYGYNRVGAQSQEGVRRNWWRQSMMGGIKAQYDCVKAFSETDFTNDLKKISVPTLLLHGDDDQIVPYKDASVRAAKLIPNATLVIYPGFPHGMCTTHAETINADVLTFIKKHSA